MLFITYNWLTFPLEVLSFLREKAGCELSEGGRGVWTGRPSSKMSSLYSGGSFLSGLSFHSATSQRGFGRHTHRWDGQKGPGLSIHRKNSQLFNILSHALSPFPGSDCISKGPTSPAAFSCTCFNWGISPLWFVYHFRHSHWYLSETHNLLLTIIFNICHYINFFQHIF